MEAETKIYLAADMATLIKDSLGKLFNKLLYEGQCLVRNSEVQLTDTIKAQNF